MRRTIRFSHLAISLLLLFFVCVASARATTKDDSAAEVRRVAEQSFEELRAGDYGALYNRLPTVAQRRISRERFINALERTRGFYDLDRLQINAVHTAGDLAVVDTTVYGRAKQFSDVEGKIIARQYLVRENGEWRVTAGDRASAERLLAANPQFARKYPPRAPRILIKQNGRWIDAREMAKNLRKRTVSD